MKKITFIVLTFLSLTIFSQNSLVKNIPFTNIGPTIMSGRVVDIDVNPKKPSEFYVAYATGGVWYTDDNGTSFTVVTDNNAPTQNIGAIAIDWENETIWIGTGENNSSRSSYSGIGVIKSTDKGKSWKNVGLKDSQHIGNIVINKNNPNDVVIASLGNLYKASTERGIYRTLDGGKTWQKTLYVNEDTGFIDVQTSPTNANIIYAASWERERRAWNFKGSGKGSAIYKSIDGGSTWKKVSENNGFPKGDGVGRIGLAVYNDDIVYALLDNQFRQQKKNTKKKDELKKEDFKIMSNDDFLKIEDKKLDAFLRQNRFEKKYTSKKVKTLVKNGKAKPSDLATYLENANALLFDTPVIGAELYKTSDGGKNWDKTHKELIEDLYYSYGYYFGTIAVNTANQNKVYIGGVPLLKSDDGGKTFTSISKENVHSDHQALWVNPDQEGHIVNGNDGGINVTFNDGKSWSKNNSIPIGQFYAINVDNQKPYNVYGGLQDNGVWFGPSSYSSSRGWEGSGKYPYQRIGGGDGMQVEIDNRDHNLIYTGLQFGNYYRVNLKTKERLTINPKHELGESPYRYNWQTPILLSKHNQDILYMGANKLLRSMNQGKDFQAISGDLTTGGKKGNVPYGTLTTISESPFQFGLVYVGSDDGYINLTKDGGATWNRISDDLPQQLWVSRVIASKHKKERVYITLNGYRDDNFKPYVYVSEDYGNSWNTINANLPDSPVNVIKEDPVDENILYLGTDNALYTSLDRGAKWQLFSKGLPKVATHDLVIQEDAKDLVVGTHGRSIYKTNIAGLQNFNKVKDKPITIFEIAKQRFSSRWGSTWSKWGKPFEPKTTIEFYTQNGGDYTISVLNDKNLLMNTMKVKTDAGFNYKEYDLSINEKNIKSLNKKGFKSKKAKNGFYYLPKGTYTIKIAGGNNETVKKLIIK